jgi:hypothetical protein
VLNRCFCQDLSRQARQVLYGLLVFLNARKPREPIFAFRDTLLPETLLGSRSALFRGLNELEQKHYIRREQSRLWGASCYGQFTRSLIYLEDKALLPLALVASEDCLPDSPPLEDSERLEAIEAWEASRMDWEDDETGWEGEAPPREAISSAVASTYPQRPCPELAHGIQEGEPTLELQLKGQLPTHEQIPEPSSSLKDSDEKPIDPHTRLPNDVIPLMKLGVSKTLICTLMGYAKRQGQQGALGAAVKLFWQHIEGLRGRSVFAYLRKVLSQKRDYAYLLKQQTADEIDGVLTTTASTRLSEKLANLLARCDGFVVRNAEGHTIGTIRANGETGHVEGFDPKRGRFAIPANLRFMQAVEEGRLHLRAA